MEEDFEEEVVEEGAVNFFTVDNTLLSNIQSSSIEFSSESLEELINKKEVLQNKCADFVSKEWKFVGKEGYNVF